jgi:predicted O-linked N-acetylglucosamine transferase (SPINDLY family)
MTSSPLPPQAQAWLQQAVGLHQSGKISQAKALYDQILAVAPQHAPTLSLLGMVEAQAGRPDAAVQYFGLSLAIDPNQPDTHFYLGNAQMTQRRFDAAFGSFDAAVALQPQHGEAWRHRGDALRHLGQVEMAIDSYNQALTARATDVQALLNRGETLHYMGRIEEALTDFETAASVAPDRADTHYNVGIALTELRRLDAASASLDTAIALKAAFPWLAGQALTTRMHLAQWDGFRERRDRLIAQINRGEPAVVPFQGQALIDAPAAQRKVAETYVAAMNLKRQFLPPPARPARHERIRVGYFSSDFNDHPVSHLLAGVLEKHDRTKFEVFAFALRPTATDVWRARIRRAASQFIDVSAVSDIDAIRQARELEIDIAIDLNGFTDGNRAALFAERVAPVQASYIGYLGTMGAPWMDYLIADDMIVPEASRRFYAEKIASLPCYQPNDSRQTLFGDPPTRAELGLPEDAFVFCSFNQTYKITPEVFDSWMRILAKAPGSVLWLLATDPAIADHLKAETQKRGVDTARLIFADRVSYEEHLARQSAADLFLDTHPYNAGATASNALRMGLPVLTRVGEAFQARMGASLLNGVGLPEMVTSTPKDYEALAIKLATDAGAMAGIRQKLADHRPGAPLFDTERTTRALESLYTTMYERSQAGQPPEHIKA